MLMSNSAILSMFNVPLLPWVCVLVHWRLAAVHQQEIILSWIEECVCEGGHLHFSEGSGCANWLVCQNSEISR